MSESIAMCLHYPSFPSFKEHFKFHFKLFVFLKSKDSGTDIKCQLFSVVKRRITVLKVQKRKGRYHLLNYEVFCFDLKEFDILSSRFFSPHFYWLVWIVSYKCLSLTLSTKWEMTSIEPAPSCVLPALCPLTICFTQA